MLQRSFMDEKQAAVLCSLQVISQGFKFECAYAGD